MCKSCVHEKSCDFSECINPEAFEPPPAVCPECGAEGLSDGLIEHYLCCPQSEK